MIKVGPLFFRLRPLSLIMLCYNYFPNTLPKRVNKTSYASDSQITLRFYRVYSVVSVSHMILTFRLCIFFLLLPNACTMFWYEVQASSCSAYSAFGTCPFHTAGVLFPPQLRFCGGLVWGADHKTNMASLPEVAVSLKGFWQEIILK